MPSEASPNSAESNANRSIIKSMLAACSSIFGSRLSGLARDICMAWYWGATGAAQAAFNVAFAIPNSLRALFGEGAFSSAFVPMITERLADGRQKEAWQLANRSITLQGLVMLGCFMLVSAIDIILYLLCKGTIDETTQLTYVILPILMPYSLLICVTGAFGAVLNSLRRFAAPSLVPVIFNVVQISSICLLVFLSWKNTEMASLLLFCGGAVFAGFLQLFVMYLLCRRAGYSYHPDFHWKCPEVHQLCMNILPGLIGAGVMQLNSLVDKFLGLYLGPEAVGALNYSQHLVYLPVGIFGVAMSTVCLPALTRARATNDPAQLKSSLDFALGTVLFMALPCALLLLALGPSVIGLLFAHGAFTMEALNNSYFTLMFYLLGLPAFCCVKVAATPFHARLDTRTPVKIGLSCMTLNLVLNIVLMQFLKQGGLALSTSICSWLNVSLLLACNRKHLPGWSPLAPLASFAGLLIPSFMAAGGALAIRLLLSGYSPTLNFQTNLLAVAGGGCTGLLIYLAICLVMKRPELMAIIRTRSKTAKT